MTRENLYEDFHFKFKCGNVTNYKKKRNEKKMSCAPKICAALRKHYVSEHFSRMVRTLCDEEYRKRMGYTDLRVAKEVRELAQVHFQSPKYARCAAAAAREGRGVCGGEDDFRSS